MPIVSSTYVVDAHTQASGTRYVYETHVDSTGRVHALSPWLAPDGMDIASVVSERAVQISEQLAQAELNAMLEQD